MHLTVLVNGVGANILWQDKGSPSPEGFGPVHSVGLQGRVDTLLLLLLVGVWA